MIGVLKAFEGENDRIAGVGFRFGLARIVEVTVEFGFGHLAQMGDALNEHVHDIRLLLAVELGEVADLCLLLGTAKLGDLVQDPDMSRYIL